MKIDPMDGRGNMVFHGEITRREIHVNDEKTPVVAMKKQQEEDVQKAIEEFSKKMERLRKIFRGEAEFKYDKEINMVIVKIRDTETGELIRQIPPEVMVKLAKSINELLGILMDERV
ncbi:flagellar protein FlaG [Thermotoga sp. KOL6]|uniref:flagellar protein FlaG n=1 Tax=Thermotoga sp. KOL6 TaxID=126741 RepID=UPI000C756D52|nr:flagellar protein FlaG [Thermotoga sp. KOL6]PLV59858.1 flagellar biosynthesis protein FlaG [Thermotoga sp. KOL6]